MCLRKRKSNLKSLSEHLTSTSNQLQNLTRILAKFIWSTARKTTLLSKNSACLTNFPIPLLICIFISFWNIKLKDTISFKMNIPFVRKKLHYSEWNMSNYSIKNINVRIIDLISQKISFLFKSFYEMLVRLSIYVLRRFTYVSYRNSQKVGHFAEQMNFGNCW